MRALFKTARLFFLRAGISSIRLYQKYIALRFGSVCRFYPSCSHYFIAALEKYGMARGSVKGILRVLRCNPFFSGGYDPVESCNYPTIEVRKCRKELF